MLSQFFSLGQKKISFLKTKELMTRAPTLTLPNHNKQFIIATNSLHFSIRGVLLQEDCNGYENPVAFFSKKTLPAETNYPFHNKECLQLLGKFKNFNIISRMLASPLL